MNYLAAMKAEGYRDARLFYLAEIADKTELDMDNAFELIRDGDFTRQEDKIAAYFAYQEARQSHALALEKMQRRQRLIDSRASDNQETGNG